MVDPNDVIRYGKADVTGRSEPTYGGLTDAASLEHVAEHQREKQQARSERIARGESTRWERLTHRVRKKPAN